MKYLPLLLLLSSCTTTFYRDGKKIASFQGNMKDTSFSYSAKGDLTWTAKDVNHSAPTLAGGRAAAFSISSVAVPAASVLSANQFNR